MSFAHTSLVTSSTVNAPLSSPSTEWNAPLHEHVAASSQIAASSPPVDRVDQLVRLLDHVGADAPVRLRPVPRAAVGRAQQAQKVHEVVVIEPRLFQEGKGGDDHRAGVVICKLPVRLEQFYLLRLPPRTKKASVSSPNSEQR